MDYSQASITENIFNMYELAIPNDELGLGWIRYIFLLNGILSSETYFWSNLGITWTIPIFAFFYLVAPFVLKRIKCVKDATIIWLVVFVLCKVVARVYSCTLILNLSYLFIGVLIFWCLYKNIQDYVTIIFQIVAIGMLVLGKIEPAYVFMFATIMLLFVKLESRIWIPEFCRKIVNALDKYTYTLYLVHGIVFCSLLDRLNRYGVSKYIIAIIAIAATLIITFIVGKYLEKPIQKYLSTKLLKKENKF